MLGKILGGRYELLEKIGGGGMAIVYKAKCHLLKRYVAVKILRPELVEDEEFVNRFKRESQAAASLSHPNIVNIYDVGEEDDIYYIVMEYVKGKTLKEYIKDKKRLDPEEAVKIGIQIASALRHAHKNNIVHRDIKPQNILIGDDGTAKVADFGIARAVTSSTVTIAGANVIGSVHYFSPEQARGGYVDTKSDLYSLGIVLYEMVTGTVPFEGDSAISVALKHIQEKVTPPGQLNPDIPRSLQDIIEKSIEKDQNKRYQTAEEMVRDLKHALKDPNGDFVVREFDSDAPTQIISPVTAKAVNEKKPREAATQQKRRQWLKISLVILPFVLVTILAFYIGSRIYRNNFVIKEVEIPDITGIAMEDAQKILRERDLFLEVIGQKNSIEVEEGHIISQEPEHGIKVKTYSTIRVVISMGPETVEVPDVVGKPLREAEIILENAGLKIEEPEYVYSNFPSDIIVDQSISPHTEVFPDTQIKLTVSKGPEEKVVTVGKYVGHQVDVARQLIRGDGLTVGDVDEEFSDTVEKGTVIRQYPPEGDTVEEYRKVDLVVSAGPIPTYPKDLRIDLTQIKNRDTVNIVVVKVQNGKTTEVYNKYHAVNEGNVVVRLEGKGTAQYKIYVDGKLSHTEIVDFTKKQEEVD